jgi:hypothetical protein
MSKQANPSKQIPTPAEQIAACESDIRRLEHERADACARGLVLTERRRAASYGAHVQHDADSRRELDCINAEIGAYGSELESLGDALATVRARLAEAQQALAREEEREHILGLRKHNDEVRKLGPWLDEAVADYVGGLRGLLKASGLGLPHPSNGQQVLMLYRCLLVAFRGTPWEREFGVADSNDKKTFGSHASIIDQWCNANERDFEYRLAALDGEQTKTEAAA